MNTYNNYVKELQNRVYEFCQLKRCKICGDLIKSLFKGESYEKKDCHNFCYFSELYKSPVSFANFTPEETTEKFFTIIFQGMGECKNGFFRDYSFYNFDVYKIAYQYLPLNKIDDFLFCSLFLMNLLEKSRCPVVMIENMNWIKELMIIFKINPDITIKDISRELEDDDYCRGFCGVITFRSRIMKIKNTK